MARVVAETDKLGLHREEAARRLGITYNTLRHQLNKVRQKYEIDVPRLKPNTKPKEEPRPEYPTFIDPNLPAEEIIAHLEAAGERKLKRKKQEKWFPVTMPSDDPFTIVFMGDPHLGTKTLWKQLRADCKTIASTRGMWAINAGDTVDHWPMNGRLVRLWAENDISMSTEWVLVDWFFHKAMPKKWLVWLLGNHDTFNTNSAAMFKEISQNVVPVFDTEALFILETPNKSAFPVIARHDFPGHSQYNTLHAIMRYLRERADVSRGLHILGLEGHKHQWARHDEENADRGYFFTAVRARGYKMPDDHVMHLNLASQEYAPSVAITYNPRARNLATMMMIHYDVQEAAEYLKWMRRRFR